MDRHNTLVINCGSSSLKFAVINTQTSECLIQGLAERLGSPQASIKFQIDQQSYDLQPDTIDHQGAITTVLNILQERNLLNSLNGVGHRVVHGGETFSQSIILNQDILQQLEQLNHLAPLHNPMNILGIHAITQLLPDLPQVAVFDTAFHQTLPDQAYLYALPYELYEKQGIRRYGFHGTSFRYVSQQAAQLLNKPLDECHLLIAHLGNGCSACAIKNGESVDTSMGLTPLEGLAMGTRSGDIDPGLPAFLCQRLNMDLNEVMDLLNKKSGLLGLSGVSNDMREIQQAAAAGNKRANLALEIFAFRIARYLGALAISLPKIDALVFTGGIGENDKFTRSLILEHLAILGFELDGELNAKNGKNSDIQGRISASNSKLALVIATNEELMIAQDTQALVAK